jgi:hypothetical protein
LRIPDIQDRLRELSAAHGINELSFLADELSRRSPTKRAPNVSQPMTDELAERIRAYARSHPNATQVQIGVRFEVNPGRVSEALRGYRQ